MFGRDKIKPEEEQIPNVDYTEYEEGIYVGYHHFDKHNLEVSFPFGYGLSYSDFEYRNMEVELDENMIHITIQAENTGELAGKEAVEIYVSKPDSEIDRPVQDLKASAKTPLLQS